MCFQDNLLHFTPAQSEPEKHNLYNGLYNLSEALENDLASIERLLQEILAELRRR